MVRSIDPQQSDPIVRSEKQKKMGPPDQYIALVNHACMIRNENQNWLNGLLLPKTTQQVD